MTPPGLRLEAAGAGSAPLLGALHAASTDDAWPAADMARFLAMPGTFGLLASLDEGAAAGAPCGFALGRVAAGECEVLNIAVLPQARRRGVGRALLERLAAAAAAGATELLLEVAVDNPAARRLYESLDFAEVGRRRSYYARPDGRRVDALVLRRRIG